MEIIECIFYGVVIGILIVILIKLCKSIKENFENLTQTESQTQTAAPETAAESQESDAVKNIDETVKEEKKEETEGEGKSLLGKVVDGVKDAAASVVDAVKGEEKEEDEEEKGPVALTQAALNNDVEGPASVNAVETEGVSDDLTILPKFIDTTTSTVMDGAKLIPQSTVDAWQDVYMNEDNDNSFMIDLGGDDKKTNKDQGSGRFSDRSPACCSAQYPVPFKIPVDKEIVDGAKDYVPNPYMGNNNWMNAGCTCMKKDNASKLATRGGNA